MTDFLEIFAKFYSDMAAHISCAELVEQERYVSKLIELDFASELFQIDEILILRDILRDECVRRLARSVSSRCLPAD